MTPSVLSRADADPGRAAVTVRVPVRLRCDCGSTAIWAAAPGKTWRCPGCQQTWRPHPDAVRTVSAGARDLVRLRTHLVWLMVALAAIVVVLVALQPEWILGAPLLVGGTLLVLQPTYRRRRSAALGRVRTVIALHRVTSP